MRRIIIGCAILLLLTGGFLLRGGESSEDCQYRERLDTHQNRMVITTLNGEEVDRESIDVRDVRYEEDPEKCRFSFTLENREPVELRVHLRYRLADPEVEKSVIVDLDPRATIALKQTHAVPGCRVDEESFAVKFINARYAPSMERVTEWRCRLCDGVECKNDGEACLRDRECGSARCAFGVCQSSD